MIVVSLSHNRSVQKLKPRTTLLTDVFGADTDEWPAYLSSVNGNSNLES